MLACVFYSCLRTSSSLVCVCWVNLFKASTRLSVSKCGGLKCLPFCDMSNFCRSLGSASWGLKCLPQFVGVWLFTRGLKCLPPFVGVG